MLAIDQRRAGEYQKLTSLFILTGTLSEMDRYSHFRDEKIEVLVRDLPGTHSWWLHASSSLGDICIHEEKVRMLPVGMSPRF